MKILFFLKKKLSSTIIYQLISPIFLVVKTCFSPSVCWKITFWNLPLQWSPRRSRWSGSRWSGRSGRPVQWAIMWDVYIYIYNCIYLILIWIYYVYEYVNIAIIIVTFKKSIYYNDQEDLGGVECFIFGINWCIMGNHMRYFYNIHIHISNSINSMTFR